MKKVTLNNLTFLPEHRTAFMFLKREDLLANGFQKGDTEGFVNYGLSIAGTKMSAFFMEDLYEDFIKISFRSKDDVDTNAFARAHFHGGGHINASGGKYFKNIYETIEDFKEKIEEEEF